MNEDSDNEYNFSWLDPDKKVSVLQNRKFRKASRPEVSLGFGLANSSPYTKSYAVNPRLSYYWSESWGLEAFYTSFSNSANDTAKVLVGTGVYPNVISVKNEVGAMLAWAPWYAKINVFNTVLHFDWYFAGGLGTMNLDLTPGGTGAAGAETTKSTTAYYFSTGHLYHVNDNFDVRLDFKNAWFKAPQRATSGPDSWFNSSAFTLGVGYKL